METKEKSMKETEEGIGLFVAFYDESIPVSLVLLGEVFSPFLVPLFLLYSLLFELLKPILSLNLIFNGPLGFDLVIEAFILSLSLFFHLDQPHDSFLCGQEISLINSLLQQWFSFNMKRWIELLNGSSCWMLPRALLFVALDGAIKGSLIDKVFLLPFDKSPQFLPQIGVHILLVSVIEFALNQGNGS